MCRKPEQGYRLLEHELPLYTPIQSLHNLAHRYGTEQATQGTTGHQDMRVGDFVERHEHGRKNTVHGNGDGKSQ